MTLMQQLQYLSAVFYGYIWYSAFQICEPCEIRTVCAVLFFLYPNISDSRSSKKALVALEGHHDKEPTSATSWVSNKLQWWLAVSYEWYPGFTLKARISLVWYSLSMRMWAWLETWTMPWDYCRLLCISQGGHFSTEQCKRQPCKFRGSLTLVVLHYCYSNGTIALWNSSCSPIEVTKAWPSMQMDSFRKLIILPWHHKDILLNGKITGQILKTIQNGNI